MVTSYFIIGYLITILEKEVKPQYFTLYEEKEPGGKEKMKNRGRKRCKKRTKS